MPEEFVKDRLNFFRSIAFDHLTADGQVCLGPCFLFHATLVGAAGGAATAILYDGHGTTEDKMIDMAAVQTGVDDRSYNPPVYFRRGLYLDVGNNVTSVELLYLPVKE